MQTRKIARAVECPAPELTAMSATVSLPPMAERL